MKNDALMQAEKNLRNPFWRLNNLYWIIDKEGNKTLFKMNWAQEELYHGLWYCNIILKARQLGISTFVSLLYLDRCLFNSHVSAGIIAHTKEDAEMLFRRVKFAYENLAPELQAVRTVNMDNARELQFNNGSLLRVGTSMRGSTLQYLHISEYGKICAKYPEKAREIATGSLNTIAAGQYVIIESTAEGRSGAFYEMCKVAQAMQDANQPLSKLDYKFWFFPWWKHPDYSINPDNVPIPQDLRDYFTGLEQNEKITLSKGQKAWYAKKFLTQSLDMKREYPATPTESFATANEGLYYGALMTRARSEGRIRKVYWEEKFPVYTAWDLGFSDSTAIWFFQLCGQEIHLLEYHEDSGKPLTHYIKLVKDKPYSYGKHFVPHDAAACEYSSGLSREEVARDNGINFTIVAKVKVIEGIDAVRNILNRCWFDEEKCAVGIRMIENYKRAWDDKNGCWKDDPVHNEASHGSDAFRYLALSMQDARPSMSKQDLDKLKSQASVRTGQSFVNRQPPMPNYSQGFGR
jgi:hypothetical protein